MVDFMPFCLFKGIGVVLSSVNELQITGCDSPHQRLGESPTLRTISNTGVADSPYHQQYGSRRLPVSSAIRESPTLRIISNTGAADPPYHQQYGSRRPSVSSAIRQSPTPRIIRNTGVVYSPYHQKYRSCQLPV
jgi:hypothetical protein